MQLFDENFLYPAQRVRWNIVKQAHPDAILIQCADDYSRKRFSTPPFRVNNCEWIGSGGRNKTKDNDKPKGHQIWASWAQEDLFKFLSLEGDPLPEEDKPNQATLLEITDDATPEGTVTDAGE